MTEFYTSPFDVFTTKYLLVRKNENIEPDMRGKKDCDEHTTIPVGCSV